MNRDERRKREAALRTAKIIKSAGMVPTHWLWVGEAETPPEFDKDRIADYVLNKKLQGKDGTCRFHTVNPVTGNEIHFVAVLADGEMMITICDTEARAKDVYAKLKPPGAIPIKEES